MRLIPWLVFFLLYQVAAEGDNRNQLKQENYSAKDEEGVIDGRELDVFEHQQADHEAPSNRGTPKINEVLYNPILFGRPEQRYAFVEIYREDLSFALNRCNVSNVNQTFSVEIPAEATAGNITHSYFTILHVPSLVPSLSLEKPGKLLVRSLDLGLVDGLALFCDEEMVDYVAWGTAAAGPSGRLHDQAVSEKQWKSTNTFVAPSSFDNNLLGLRLRPVQDGESIGRDKDSTDTDSELDWQFLGGRDSLFPTPGKRNLHPIVLSFVGPIQPPPPPQQPRAEQEWTYMSFFSPGYDARGFYNAGDDLRADFKIQMNDMAQSGSTKKVNFVFQYEYTRAYAKIGGGLDTFPLVLGAPFRPDNSKTLGDFIAWAKKNYPAKKYALEINGHGYGWKGANVFGDRNDGPNTYTLSMTELREALKALGQKFSVVYLFECLMGGLEVAYQIRDQTEYVTFSEELMLSVPTRPKEVSAMWRSNARQMAIIIAKIYIKGVKKSGNELFKKIVTVSVVDTKLVDPLVTMVDKFSASLIRDMDNYKTHDKPTDNLNIVWATEIRPRTEYFVEYVDLKHLALLTQRAGVFSASGKAGAVVTAVGKAVIFNAHGSGHPNANGLHIYHPSSLLEESNRERAYDDTWPASSIYALDAKAKIDGIIFPAKHSKPVEGNFLYTKEDHQWDEFLVRFYKPTADACVIKEGETDCRSEATINVGERVTVSGMGSSDGDAEALEFWWDLNPSVDSPAKLKKYKEGVKYVRCREDCDRNNVDDNDDDPDKRGPSWEFPCEEAGTFTFKLWVWDKHHESDKKYEENMLHNKGNHYLHFQVDSEVVTVTCLAPSESPSYTVVPTTYEPTTLPPAPTTLPPTTSPPMPSPSGATPTLAPTVRPTAMTSPPTKSPSLPSPSDSPLATPALAPSLRPTATTSPPTKSPSLPSPSDSPLGPPTLAPTLHLTATTSPPTNSPPLPSPSSDSPLAAPTMTPTTAPNDSLS